MPAEFRKLIINSKELSVEAALESRLIDVLREELRLTGTKEGCGEGECGACSVLINDEAVNSCLVLFGQLSDGDRITTIEGIGDAEHLTPLQECFVTDGGTQCGMCTPGMIIAAHALLMKNPKPARDEIADALAGNLCRCTGYKKIIDAVEKAANIKVPDTLHSGGRKVSDTLQLPAPKVSDTLLNMVFAYHKPPSLPEALALLAANSEGLPVLAGGTDLIAQWRTGAIGLKGVIDIGSLSELRVVTEREGAIEIGALATHSQIASNDIVQSGVPILAEACRSIGAVQIQNRGTIGGNIMNASPAGDVPPVLIAVGAKLKVQNLKGERWIPADKFFTAYRKTALEPDELLTCVRVSKQNPEDAVRFYKVGARRAQVISKVVMCVRGRVWHGGIDNITIAIGSVAPTVVTAPGTEALLRGRVINKALIDRARHSLEDEVHPIDDVRSTAGYRRFVCGGLIARYLRGAASIA